MIYYYKTRRYRITYQIYRILSESGIDQLICQDKITCQRERSWWLRGMISVAEGTISG